MSDNTEPLSEYARRMGFSPVRRLEFYACHNTDGPFVTSEDWSKAPLVRRFYRWPGGTEFTADRPADWQSYTQHRFRSLQEALGYIERRMSK